MLAAICACRRALRSPTYSFALGEPRSFLRGLILSSPKHPSKQAPVFRNRKLRYDPSPSISHHTYRSARLRSQARIDATLWLAPPLIAAAARSSLQSPEKSAAKGQPSRASLGTPALLTSSCGHGLSVRLNCAGELAVCFRTANLREVIEGNSEKQACKERVKRRKRFSWQAAIATGHMPGVIAGFRLCRR